MEVSEYLKELDLSWSMLRPSSFRRFMESLRHNRQLTHLTLSYNILMENTNAVSNQKPLEIGGEEFLDYEKALAGHNLEVLQCLKEFIKYNISLIYLGL